MESVSLIYFHLQCAWAILMPPPSTYMLLHECCSRCINIYPRDVCPCSATAKPLSRKVNFTFPLHPPPHPIHISHLSYTIHAIHQPSRGGAPDYLQQLSRVLNSAAGWLGLGAGRAAAARIDILILHSRNRSMSDCGQKRVRFRAASSNKWAISLSVGSHILKNEELLHQIYNFWPFCFIHINKNHHCIFMQYSVTF